MTERNPGTMVTADFAVLDVLLPTNSRFDENLQRLAAGRTVDRARVHVELIDRKQPLQIFVPVLDDHGLLGSLRQREHPHDAASRSDRRVSQPRI